MIKMTNGFNIRHERNKQRNKLVGSERSLKLNLLFGSYTMTNIYKPVQANKRRVGTRPYK